MSTQQVAQNYQFLPTTVKEMQQRGWNEPDVVLISGDAYVDHPSFGVAVIGRLLEREGLRVVIVSQPSWRDDLRDFKKFGKPRLFFGVTAGAMDSMVNHYTAAKRLRSDDAYTAGGKAGMRPDYAVTVYSKILKELYPNTPVVIGGIEASLRRLTHYDYWQDKLLPSVLISSGADILSYGMGEKSIIDIAKALNNGFNINLLRKLPQVAFLADKKYVDRLPESDTIILKSFEKCVENKKIYAENFKLFEVESNKLNAKKLVEPYQDKFVVVNPPYLPLTTKEMDNGFDLPYTRRPHPKYHKRGAIPAYDMIKYSINLHRGCFGGCSFCTISAHQGKFISSRSEESIFREIEQIKLDPEFKGNLSDIGGPSANMYKMSGADKEICLKCSKPSCIFPKVCANLNNSHKPLLKLYSKIREIKGIRRAYIGSGIRYDMIDTPSRERYLTEVIRYHTSGRLKVAPEHTSDRVLRSMRKPSFELFRELNRDFKSICNRHSLPYQLIPYFISSHPECRVADMEELSRSMTGLNFELEQVQDFTPTPMTLSTTLFYTGFDPYLQKDVYVEREIERKKYQRSFFFKEKNSNFTARAFPHRARGNNKKRR